MQQLRSFTVKALAEACGGALAARADYAAREVRRVATIHDADDDAITWITEPRHLREPGTQKAAAVVGPSKLLASHPRPIIVEDPELAIALILDKFAISPAAPAPGVHPMAFVDPSARVEPGAAIGAHAAVLADARIGAGTIIHQGVSIGRGVHVGKSCRLFDRCVIYDGCTIGDRVILHAGVVVGADGFGYIFRDGAHRKLAHVGTVIIEDDVEVGPNSCIDRAKTGATRIGRGTKIDALVMIAHNVQIGPLCIIIAQCGLSGSVQLGAGVVLAGQCGIVQGLKLGDGARIGAKSVVMNDVEAGHTVLGMPAQDRTTELRQWARIRKLATLFEDVAELSERVSALEAATDHPGNG